MTVKKDRCTNCKKYFPADTMLVVTVGKFHNSDCLIEYGITRAEQLLEKAKKHKKKVRAKEKREYQNNDLSIRKAAAKAACHKYINLRDKGNTCICCGRPLISGVNAGHFHESGNNPLIRYDEDNIHSQSVYCNKYQGGDSGDYRPNLIKKIGIERVERLDKLKGGTMKRTCEDYREIEEYYKGKIAQMNKYPEPTRQPEVKPNMTPGRHYEE